MINFSITATSPFTWKDTPALNLGQLRTDFAKEATQIAQNDLAKIFMANKNICCLNEKIKEHNDASKKGAQQFELLAPIPLPQIVQATKTAAVSNNRLKGLFAPQEHAPDPKLAHAWATAQHPSIQPLAYTLAKAAIDHYVDFPTFVSALDESVEQATKKISNKAFGIATWGKPEGSSGAWVKSLMKLKKKPNTSLHITYDKSAKKSVAAFEKATKTKTPIKEWILVDDAAYTGEQLFSTILPAVIDELEKKYPKGGLRLHVVIPYMSSHVIERLVEKEKESKNAKVKVTFSYATKMPNIAETAQHLSPEDRDAGACIADTFGRAPYACTTYLAHKVGDGLSLPRALSDGAVYTSTYKGLKNDPLDFWQNKKLKGCLTTGFIPEFTPHYKTAQKS